MCQHRLAAQIADGVDVAHAGLAATVDLDRRTIHIQVQRFEVPALGVRFAADGDQHLIGFQIQGFALRIAHLQGAIETQHAVFEVQLHAQLLQRVMHRLRQFSVICRQDSILRFNHADLGTELAISDAQFQTNVTTADHDQTFRHGFRRQRFGGGDDRPANRQDRQIDAGRTSGQH
ncbi:hypothetical protein D3C81_1551330 [compost metagenome]